MTNNNADEYANQRIGILFPGFPTEYTGQCVSLVKWFIGEMCGVSDWQSARGNAKDFGDTLVNQGLAYIIQESERKRGDIVVWKKDGGGYGHIGVLCSNDNVFEENVGLNGTPYQNIPDGSGGYTKVYVSRLDPLYINWRIGNPTFYRMIGYNETQINQGEDMIDQKTLILLFNIYLGRNPDADAISHYVGNYTTSFVVSDLNASSERAQIVANNAAKEQDIQNQLTALNAQVATDSSIITDLRTQIDDLNKQIIALNEKINSNVTSVDSNECSSETATTTQPTEIIQTETSKSSWLKLLFDAIKKLFTKEK